MRASLLVESWAGESAAARLAFLPLLAERLSVEDEPLLERALRDRRKDVRQTALGLIRRLPDSDFARRWSGRARQIVRPLADRIVVRELRTVVRIGLRMASSRARHAVSAERPGC